MGEGHYEVAFDCRRGNAGEDAGGYDVRDVGHGRGMGEGSSVEGVGSFRSSYNKTAFS